MSVTATNSLLFDFAFVTLTRNSSPLGCLQLLSMIKGTASLLRKHKTLLVRAINQQLHFEMQEFMHVALRELIRRTIKKKKKMLTRCASLCPLGSACVCCCVCVRVEHCFTWRVLYVCATRAAHVAPPEPYAV
eukprot:Opistho-1_new@77621